MRGAHCNRADFRSAKMPKKELMAGADMEGALL